MSHSTTTTVQDSTPTLASAEESHSERFLRTTPPNTWWETFVTRWTMNKRFSMSRYNA